MDEIVSSTDRRGFLKQMATLAGAAPLGARALGVAGTGVLTTIPISDVRAANAPFAAAPFTGYEFLGPDDASRASKESSGAKPERSPDSATVVR